jgi:hypothetical protein
MPAGLLVTVPLPLPILLTVRPGEFTVNVTGLLLSPAFAHVKIRGPTAALPEIDNVVVAWVVLVMDIAPTATPSPDTVQLIVD